MDTILQISGLAIVVAVLCTIIRKTDSALSTAAVLLFCVLSMLAIAHVLSPVLQFLKELTALTGVGKAYLEPVGKTCAIALITQVAAGVCSETGTGTLAQIAQICGTAASLYVMLPLLRAVLELIRTLIGG